MEARFVAVRTCAVVVLLTAACAHAQSVVLKVDRQPGNDIGQKIAACVENLPPQGGICDAQVISPDTQMTISAPLNIGKPTKPVTLLINPASTYLITVNDPTYSTDAITIWDKSGIVVAVDSPNSYFSGADANFTLVGKVRSIITNGGKAGEQAFFTLRNVGISVDSKGSIRSTAPVGACVDLQGLSSGGVMENNAIIGCPGIGLHIQNNGTVGFGAMSFVNNWINCELIPGCRPLVIESASQSSAGLIAGVNFFGGTYEHAGPGQYQIEVNGHGAGVDGINYGVIGGVSFYGIYMENMSPDGNGIKLNDVYGVLISGATMSGTAVGTDVVTISETQPMCTGSIVIDNLRDNSGFPHTINDTTRTPNDVLTGSIVSHYAIRTPPIRVITQTPVTLAPSRFANLGSAKNGTMLYCTDCTITPACSPGGTGAIAKRINDNWSCN